MPSDWEVLTYAREHKPTGNRLMMSLVDGKPRYVVLTKADGAYVAAYRGTDGDEAKRIAEASVESTEKTT